MISEEIRRFMLDSLARGHSPTIRECMERFGCSRRTAQYARSALLKTGAIPAGIIRKGGRPPVNRLPDPPDFSNATDAPPAEMIQRVLSGESVPLTTEQQRALLSELMLHSPNHAIKVAAQNALTKLDAQSGGGVSYAPATPLTVDQKAKRLALLMEACGFHTVKAALKIAFPRSPGVAAGFTEGLEEDAPQNLG